MSILGARRMLGPINLELGGDPEPSGSAASGSFIGISNNINGYFLTSSGSPSQIAGISPAEAAVILGVGSSTGSSGGGSGKEGGGGEYIDSIHFDNGYFCGGGGPSKADLFPPLQPPTSAQVFEMKKLVASLVEISKES